MREKLSRTELIELVEQIMSAQGTEAEHDALVDRLQSAVVHPGVAGLIYWPTRVMSAEQIVDEALAYEPIRLPASLDPVDTPSSE